MLQIFVKSNLSIFLNLFRFNPMLPLALLITFHQKFSKRWKTERESMVVNVIGGHLVCVCMKCSLGKLRFMLNRLLKHMER